MTQADAITAVNDCKPTQTGMHDQRKKKRILLVDDEPDLCMVYQIVLQDAGFECISYIDPVKALKEFRSNYYDLILLDIKMPVLNGFELCKKIIEIDKTVHIIFITASEQFYENFRKQYYSQLHDSGTNINYVQKPIGNDELIQMVNTISGTTTVALSQNEDGRMLNDIRFTSKKQEKEAGEGGNNNIFTIQ